MDKEKTTFLSDEEIDLIKEAADKNKNVNLMFLAEILTDVREIKNLLHTIASSTEQKRVSAAEMAEMLADEVSHRMQVLLKELSEEPSD